jgi:hypothetical protein
MQHIIWHYMASKGVGTTRHGRTNTQPAARSHGARANGSSRRGAPMPRPRTLIIPRRATRPRKDPSPIDPMQFPTPRARNGHGVASRRRKWPGPAAGMAWPWPAWGAGSSAHGMAPHPWIGGGRGGTGGPSVHGVLGTRAPRLRRHRFRRWRALVG